MQTAVYIYAWKLATRKNFFLFSEQKLTREQVFIGPMLSYTSIPCISSFKKPRHIYLHARFSKYIN